MVNMPVNVSAYPRDKLGLVTDINQNINQEYYEWLLKQHNYFPDCAFHQEKFEDTIKMEHSYTRDYKISINSTVMATRTILVQQPPLCPSCHLLPNHDEKVDTPEAYNIPMRPYNEEAGRRSLNSTEETIKHCHNRNSDTDDWAQSIHKNNWTEQQQNLFERVERILDMDQLVRLAATGLPNECLRRNAIIDKSVSRMRAAFASVHWEPRITSWIHNLLMTHLSTKYMVSYVDILQTLKRKIPTLVDKLLFHKPIDMHKDYMSAIMKKPWEPTIDTKFRALPNNPVMIIVSSTLSLASSNTSSRERHWLQLLNNLTSVESITVNLKTIDSQKTIEQATEHLVAMTRAKIQAVRIKTPNRPIILAGFNAGAAIALQVALAEPVNSIVCLGLAYNTLNGVRGVPDDRLLELTAPILFVIGENAQRSSQEEIESLREKMSAQTLLVLVGSSDDSLRVKRLNRLMEGVSQSMIDDMIMDEIQEFATNCILNPPGPQKPKHLNGCRKVKKERAEPLENGPTSKRIRLNGQQKHQPKSKPKIHNFTNGFSKRNNHLDESSPQMVIAEDEYANEDDILLDTPKDSRIKQKVKYIPRNQFLHLKPPPKNMQKFYVKQQNGNEPYTLGVKNIGNFTTPVLHNQLLTVKTNGQSIIKTSPNKTIEGISLETISPNNTKEADKSLNGIDIFDIPILFADNDGNIIDENQTSETVPADALQAINSVASEEIVNDFVAEEVVGDNEIENAFTHEPKDTEQMEKSETIDKPTNPTPIARSTGKFVLLNKHALSQMKSMKSIPASKFRKVIFSQGSNVRCFRASGGLSSIDSRTPRITNVIRTQTPRLQNFTRLSTVANCQSHTNGSATSPKSGILIKRNHMKNITIHEGNVMQSIKSSNLKRATDVTKYTYGGATKNDSKDDSIKSLIADLEN